MSQNFYCTILTILLLSSELYSQNISLARSTVNKGGITQTVKLHKKSYSLHQSVGQSGLIGLSKASGKHIRQGFLQPFGSRKIKNTHSYAAENLKVYPLPFHNELFIEFILTKITIKRLRIISETGKILFEQQPEQSGKVQLNTSNLPSGKYILQLQADKQTYSKLIIKQ